MKCNKQRNAWLSLNVKVDVWCEVIIAHLVDTVSLTGVLLGHFTIPLEQEAWEEYNGINQILVIDKGRELPIRCGNVVLQKEFQDCGNSICFSLAVLILF